MQSIRARAAWPSGVAAWTALRGVAPPWDAVLNGDKTERRMALVQWAVMPLVWAGGVFPAPRDHEPAVDALAAAVIMIAHPLLYLLVGLLPALRQATRTFALTATDVTVATFVFYATAARPGYAQVLLYCAVALAAARYAPRRAFGIASLVALLLVFAALLPLRVALPTVASEILALYALTGLVGLLSQAEKAVGHTATENALLARTVLQRNRELSALNRLSHAMNAAPSAPDILRLGLAGMAEALDLRDLRAYLREGDTLRPCAEEDGDECDPRGGGPERLQSALVAMHATRAIVDESAAMRADGSLRVSVPLVVRGRAEAVVQASLPLPGPTASATDAVDTLDTMLETLYVFCGELAVALENASLRSEGRRTDILQEKNRIAQELHDTVLQMLFSVGLRLQWSLDQLAEAAEGGVSPDILREPLAEARHLSARAGEELRGAIFTLSSDIAEIGLAAALQRLVDDQAAKAGWSADLVITGEAPDLPVLVQNAAHRVVREALMNAYKHARASEVMVSVRFSPGLVTLAVQDNGVGISDAALAAFRQTPDHFGLRTVAEQVENLGGAFAIHGDGDEPGTTVRATIPVEGRRSKVERGGSHGTSHPATS